MVRDGCKRNRLISELALRNTLSHRVSPMRVSRLSLTLSMTHCSDPPTFFRLIAAALTLSLRTDKLNSRCREIANVSTVTRCKQALVYRSPLDREMSLALPSTSTCPSWERCTKAHTYAMQLCFGTLCLRQWLRGRKRVVKRFKTVSRCFRARLHKVKLTAHTARGQRFDLMHNNALPTSPTLSLLSIDPLTRPSSRSDTGERKTSSSTP